MQDNAYCMGNTGCKGFRGCMVDCAGRFINGNIFLPVAIEMVVWRCLLFIVNNIANPVDTKKIICCTTNNRLPCVEYRDKNADVIGDYFYDHF